LAHTAVVAAGHRETAEAAALILAEGGNAVDGALGAMCAACVAEPVLASLGGGGFLVSSFRSGPQAGTSLVHDFFTQTPKRRRPDEEVDLRPVAADFGPAQQVFHIGHGAIATPGVVRGLIEAHRDLGFMPLRSVIEPAVALARRGVLLTPLQAYIHRVVGTILKSTPPCQALFAAPEHPGDLAGAGERLTLPELADTLEILAIEGDGLFYRGEIAERIAGACQSAGGHLSRDDLAAYRVERRPPLAVEILGARILLNPPPAAGGLLIAFALELLRDGRLNETGFGSPAHLRILAAALEETQKARMDERLSALPASEAAARFLAPELLARYRRQVLGRAAAVRGTTHISVIDRSGNAAALSISNGEGSGIVVPGTGIILNNMLGEEDVNPDGFLAWRTDQRMSSMMAPTVVLDDRGGVMALGSGGSNRLRSAILQVLVNLLAFRMAPENAVAAPRIHIEGKKLSIEPGFRDDVVDGLTLAYPEADRWAEKNLFFGGVHLACRDPAGSAGGAGDERRDGCLILV
jgi:gamma-glutamyltranspeptidase/glutathione hydrolase